jgi:hypothetical protein
MSCFVTPNVPREPRATALCRCESGARCARTPRGCYASVANASSYALVANEDVPLFHRPTGSCRCELVFRAATYGRKISNREQRTEKQPAVRVPEPEVFISIIENTGTWPLRKNQCFELR